MVTGGPQYSNRGARGTEEGGLQYTRRGPRYGAERGPAVRIWGAVWHAAQISRQFWRGARFIT